VDYQRYIFDIYSITGNNINPYTTEWTTRDIYSNRRYPKKPKDFYKYGQSKMRTKSGVRDLKTEDRETISNPQSKADLLN